VSKELILKQKRRSQRKARVRASIFGCAERPRVTFFRSNKHLYAQAIDDVNGVTLACTDGAKLGLKANKASAETLAKTLSEALQAKKVETVVFDRNGYVYHGVVAAFAEALRANGLKV
jgi:large subunit ribosomal protein L18